ncbi:MAG: endonuclease [Phycisphaerales bacterium]|nr:endonuclease [Phycisphaerales bacterium]
MARTRRAKILPGRRLKMPAVHGHLTRFLAKVQEATYSTSPDGSPCWEWQAGADDNGYGSIKIDGRREYAHRYAYAVFVRTIPAGVDIDHTCHNPRCVNPAHLAAKTPLANAVDGGRQRHRAKPVRLPDVPDDGIPF